MQIVEKRHSDGLLHALHDVLETMVMMSPARTEEIADNHPTILDDVIGILGFTGTRSGVVALNCSRRLATTICAGLLGVESHEVETDDEIADAFGEVVNMAGGNFKNLWVEEGNSMDLSIPSVVFGDGAHLCAGKNNSTGFSARVEFEGEWLSIHLRFNH